MKYQMKRERFRENIKLQKRHFYSHRYLDDCSWVLPVCMYVKGNRCFESTYILHKTLN